MKRALAYAAVASLTLVACSSTGTPTARNDRAAGLAPEVVPGNPSAAAIAGVDRSPDSVVGAGPGSAAAPGAGAPSALGGSGASAPRGGASGAIDYEPPGQGVSRSAVKVGFWLLNTDATCNATGAAGRTGRGDCGDRSHVAEANALTKWVNANGGVAGRKLEMIIHETLANNSSWVAQAESACEAFSEDEKVFIAISEMQIGRPHFTRCMAKKGIPVIDPGSWTWDSKDYEELFPYIFQPSRPRADRGIRVYVDGLAQRGFFKGDVKVGLFRFDSPSHTRVTERVLLPRLAAHGVTQVEQAVIRTPASIAALADMNSELSSHILRFKTAGVNRVLFFANAEVQFFFFRHAESQDFRPRYGMSSYDWLTLSTDNAGESQLNGAIAVGWAPGFDAPREKDPGLNPAATRCKKALAQGGIDDTWNGRNIKCDAYFFLKQVLDRAPALNVKGIRVAVEALGTGFEPVAAFATNFRLGRYDGPSAWRPLTYQGSCTCFVYTGSSTSF